MASTAGVSVGPWGGKDGTPWTYEPDSGDIRGIVIGHDVVVDSLQFLTVGGSSDVFGGPGGEEIKIVFSYDEHIISISFTYGSYENVTVISSLAIMTNSSKYGPFGTENLGTTAKIQIETGDTVGFFGRAGTYINALGMYLSPKDGELSFSGTSGPTS